MAEVMESIPEIKTQIMACCQESYHIQKEVPSANGNCCMDFNASKFEFPDEILVQVLSYLPARDQFQLQAVNTQWRRCALRVIHQLKVELFQLHCERVLIKSEGYISHNITKPLREVMAWLAKFEHSTFGHLHLHLRDRSFNDQLLKSLLKMAARARMVNVTYHIDKTLQGFGTVCDEIGPYITYLKLTADIGYSQFLPSNIVTKEFISSFRKLKKLKVIKCNVLHLLLPALIHHSEDSFHCLEEIDFSFSENSSMKLWWSKFATLYSKRITRMALYPSDCGSYSPNGCIEYLLDFVNLEVLFWKFSSVNISTAKNYAQKFQNVVVHCRRLRSLHFEWTIEKYCVRTVTEIEKESKALMEILGNIQTLETLNIRFEILDLPSEKICYGGGSRLRFKYPFEVKSDMPLLLKLGNGSNIKRFTGSSEILFYLKHLSWNIWAKLNEALPNVEDLTITCWPDELKHFFNLHFLKRIVVSSPDEHKVLKVAEKDIVDLVNSCPSLNCLVVGFELIPTEELYVSLVNAANKHMSMRQDFCATFLESDATQQWWMSYKDLAPRNLCIALKHCTNCMLRRFIQHYRRSWKCKGQGPRDKWQNYLPEWYF